MVMEQVIESDPGDEDEDHMVLSGSRTDYTFLEPCPDFVVNFFKNVLQIATSAMGGNVLHII